MSGDDEGSELDLAGAVAVVTGATRGLGRATAALLADAGAEVVIVGRSTNAEPHRLLPGSLEEVAADLRTRGAGVLAVQADLNRREDASRVVEETLAWAGRCDVLVCNASYTPAGTFLDVPVSRWTTGWNITVLSTVALVQGFLPGMLDRGLGRVLAVGSESAVHGTEPPDDWAPQEPGHGVPLLYGVTKAALERVTTGLHDEFGGRGVAFTNLRSSAIASESWHLMSGQMGMGLPLEQVHTPDEVAAAVVWVLRQPASFSGRIVDFDWLQGRGVLPVR